MFCEIFDVGLLRCGKSCRLRWINYLRADLKRGNISEEEEEMIIKLHATLGNRYLLPFHGCSILFLFCSIFLIQAMHLLLAPAHCSRWIGPAIFMSQLALHAAQEV
jgi:hypothetical protein